MKQLVRISMMSAIVGITAIDHASAGGRETVTVKAGQKTLIYQLGVYLSTCGHMAYPKFKAKKSKNGGSLTSSNGSFIANSGRCKGKRLRSTGVYYTPKPGFRGQDTAKVSLGFPVDSDSPWGIQYETIRFTINVE